MTGEKVNSTITVGDFNTPFSLTLRTTRQKISTDIEDLNNTIHQLDLIGTYPILYPTTAEKKTVFSRAQGTFSHMLGCKTSFNKYKRVATIQNMFSDHNGTKLEITTERNLGNPQILQSK